MPNKAVPSSKKLKQRIEVVVKYEDSQFAYEVDESQPVGYVRHHFASGHGLMTEEFRFVTDVSGTVLVDTDILKDLETVEVKEEKSEAPEQADVKEDLKLEADAEAIRQLLTQEDIRPKVPADEEEGEVKVRRDSDDEEKKVKVLGLGEEDSFNMLSSILGYRDPEQFMSELCKRCKAANRVDTDFIHHQANVIMRAARAQAELKKEGPKRRRLVVFVQEGFPLFLVTPIDDVRYMACVGNDTLAMVRERFGRMVGCKPQELVLRKHAEVEILTSDIDDQTMDELGMANGCAFDGERIGRGEVDIVFDFIACLKITANFDKPVEHLMKKVEKCTRGLAGSRFYFWYNNQVVPDGTNEPLGKSIFGTYFLRLMVALDPTLPPETDDGPDMTVKPEAVPCKEEEREETEDEKLIKLLRTMTPEDRFRFLRKRDFEEAARQRAARTAETSPGQQAAPASPQGAEGGGTASVKRQSGDNSGDNRESGEKANGNKNNGWSPELSPDSTRAKGRLEMIMHVTLNKRVMRYLLLLVECTRVEDMRTNSPHLPPITLPKCLPNMTLLDLRKKIEKVNGEDPDDQTLFYNGKRLELQDNFSTIRELKILGDESLYLEPSIDVFIKLPDGELLKMRRGGKSTLISDMHEWVAFKTDIPLEDIHLDFKGVSALPFLVWSDYEVKDGDEFQVIMPFRIRVWHENFVYDKMVWKHTTPRELMEELERETEVPVEQQVLAKFNELKKSGITLNMPSLHYCKISGDAEFELWKKKDFDFAEKQRRRFAPLNKDEIEAPPAMAGEFISSEVDFDPQLYPNFKPSTDPDERSDSEADSESESLEYVSGESDGE